MKIRSHRRSLLALAALLVSTVPPLAAQTFQGGDPPPPSVPPQGEAEESADERGLVHAGETLEASAIGPSVIESMAAALARQAAAGFENGPNPKARNGAPGEWQVPSMRATQSAHSGVKHVINKWGDTRMGIGFGREVEVLGAWIAVQGTRGSWTSGVQAIGYRGGAEVARTGWFESIGAAPAWFAMELRAVDRIVIAARPSIEGGGWYALDDLAFRDGERTVVLGFEDLAYHTTLTGSGYAGLDWERGTGAFVQDDVRVAPPPQVPPGVQTHAPEGLGGQGATFGGSGTAPTLLQQFIGAQFGDAGANLVPPDTCGAAGPTHFVSVTNSNLGVFLKSTGQKVLSLSLNSFFTTSGLGDPRVAYDPHHGRWIVIASTFSSTARVYFAYSLGSDPTGSWFKTFVNTAQGTDAGKWPDYPTLGVDAGGVYFAAYMVGGANGMTIFTVDKAPLLAGTPSMGTVTAFRLLPWEGAIQPCVTYGSSGSGVYFVSRNSSTKLRLRQLSGALTAPALVEKGLVTVPSHSSAPSATQKGTSATLDTIDYRPMNAVYRSGSVWTAQSVNVSGRAAVRWYEIDAASVATAQVGTISDSSLHYYMPGISANASDEMAIGFTGSDVNNYAGAYFTGRLPSDPSNETGPPVLYKVGEAPYTQISSSGVNRWGDYSLTSIDPADDKTFWTIQEYARTGNTWVTRIGKMQYACAASTSYCTAKVTSSFCVPHLADNGAQPSLASPASYVLTTTDLEPQKNALTFFSLTGANSAPFQGGFLCAASPLYRLATQNSGGAAVCTGTVSYTLADILAHPSGGPFVGAGSQLNCQTWGRDPLDPFTTSLSDGLQLVVCQ